MRLFFHPASPNSFKVRLTAAHLGLALEAEVVDFAAATRLPLANYSGIGRWLEAVRSTPAWDQTRPSLPGQADNPPLPR